MKITNLFLGVAALVLLGWQSSCLCQPGVRGGYFQVSPKQEERLTDVDYLIRYYSDFPFGSSHKIAPDFIRALILAESNGDPRARSKKNARGLTQILFTTGKAAARELAKADQGYRYVADETLQSLKPADLYDPAVNILLACYLISVYNEQYQGRLDLVVAAWNAGPGSIQHDQPPAYSETLKHIERVNGYFEFFLDRERQRSAPRLAQI